MTSSIAWNKISGDLDLHNHGFDIVPAEITATQIKQACQGLTRVTDKEVYRLRKQYSRENHPQVFEDKGLLILPKRNDSCCIVKGKGYVDIPNITDEVQDYHFILDFELRGSVVGDSEIQHVDFTYANSPIRTFMNDPSLVLTIHGWKYLPDFRCKVQNFELHISSIQMEVDAGCEGRDSIVLVEAKNSSTSNIIIQQFCFLYRQWAEQVKGKTVHTLFFEKKLVGGELIYYIWQFGSRGVDGCNSIEPNRSVRYRITQNPQ